MVIVTNGSKYQKPRYGELTFTKKDGEQVKTAFEYLGFSCCHLEELTGGEIKVLINEMGTYNYPESYHYVGFVYSGHGGQEGKKSVLLGVDGSFVDTSEDVIEPLKSIDSSICKLIFLDSCRGHIHPRGRLTKGPKSNCLVAYATQFGDVSYKHETLEGSLWLYLLADKLKEKKSLEQILSDVKDEILKTQQVQYPEVDLTDCPCTIELWRGKPEHIWILEMCK